MAFDISLGFKTYMLPYRAMKEHDQVFSRGFPVALKALPGLETYIFTQRAINRLKQAHFITE